MHKVTIDPITRLEGHGKIEIFIDDDGNVANVYFQVPELRGFEKFCEGRLAEEMPVITGRICGVCPEAHNMASVKALDDLYSAEPPAAARKLRELLYMAFFITDHTTHFYALAGPDFIVGPYAPPRDRNIFGVIRKVGLEIGKKVIDCRSRNHRVIKILGGRTIQPTGAIPGGWSKSLNEDERNEIHQIAVKNIKFALASLKVFEVIVLKNKVHYDLITSNLYLHRTHYMGTVDDNNILNLYDGMIRVVDPEGDEIAKYRPAEYELHIAEKVEPWTYLKFPYLRKVGWKGLVDGKESGVYCATPLSRLNTCDRLSTPRANEFFEKYFETFGSKKNNGRYQPVHHRMATHWARLIELLYASERMLELVNDPEITSTEVRTRPGEIKGEGIGSVEAPRGTLTHHYITDKSGVIKKVNLIVGTTNNYAPIAMSLKRAAEKLISNGNIIEEGLLNQIEMAFRLYDPCLSCATHALGSMPLIVSIKDSKGIEIKKLERK